MATTAAKVRLSDVKSISILKNNHSLIHSANRDLRTGVKIVIATSLFPTPDLPYRGVFVANQVVCLKQLGMDVRVVKFEGVQPILLRLMKNGWRLPNPTPESYMWDGVPVRVKRYASLPHNLSMLFSAWHIEMLLLELLKQELPNIVHAHFAIPVGIGAVNAACKMDIPVAVTAHGSDVMKYPSIARRYRTAISDCLNRASLVVCISNAVQECVLDVAPEGNTVVHRIGVDTRLFAPSAHNDQQCSDCFDILYVGNLTVEKGIYDLLEGFARFATRERSAKARLTYIGSGREKARLGARIASDSRLRGKVTVLLPRSNREVAELMRNCDVLVLPSHSEGLGMVAVEACACGKPVIASDIGGLPEVVQDGVNGILVRPRSPDDIADALELLSKDVEKCLHMGTMSRLLIESEYDIRQNTSALARVYDTLL